MNYDFLKVKMRTNKVSYNEMAKYLGLTLNGFANKINRRQSKGFYVDEANLIKEKLKLTTDETMQIFFN